MKPVYFPTPDKFRQWLEKHHGQSDELWVGYYKKSSGKPSITWPESVDEALCYGWIDGIRKSIDEEKYMIRFTPRKPKSNWSNVNVKRVKELIKLGRMQPPGLTAYQKKDPKKTGIYSFEQESSGLPATYENTFRKNKNAWKFFEAQIPSYRKPCIRWVLSAKQEATRIKRLQTLIEDSARGEFIAPMRWGSNAKPKKI